MSHNTMELGFIIFVLIVGFLIILDQCGCCSSSCCLIFNCKKLNRVNNEPQPSLPVVRGRPLNIIDSEIVVTGEQVCAEEIVRDNVVIIDAYVINVIE